MAGAEMAAWEWGLAHMCFGDVSPAIYKNSPFENVKVILQKINYKVEYSEVWMCICQSRES